jgi:hypothetical protein
MITVSEPDLQVLAQQISSVKSTVLIWSVAIGVGLLLVVAMLRILFKISLKYLLIILYIAVFVLAFFVPDNFLAVAFDSGGVTTGPMTVPFIMALGVGVASIRSDDGASDSFGLVALCSVGPIAAVMILGIITGGGHVDVDDSAPIFSNNSRDIMTMFLEQLPHYIFEVAVAVGPIVIFFLLFRALSGGIGQKGLGKILVGVVYTYVGLVLFLTANLARKLLSSPSSSRVIAFSKDKASELRIFLTISPSMRLLNTPAKPANTMPIKNPMTIILMDNKE